MSGLTIKVPISLNQVFIHGTTILPQLCQFWDTIRGKLAHESPYTTSIRGMRIRLFGFQNDNKEVEKLRSKKILEGWENMKKVFYYQGLPYVPEIISLELISRHHNNFLRGPFGIEKTRELIAQKLYWRMLLRDNEAYVKGCNVFLASKTVFHKLYGNFQSLPVPTHWWKDWSINFRQVF